MKNTTPTHSSPFQPQILWTNVFIMTTLHLGALYAMIYVVPETTRTQLLILWIGLWGFSGLGITAGAHRLWAHRSYAATVPLRVFLMLANSMAFQKSILNWAKDHRVHHKGSDTDSDPHNINRGFFFSHIGWLLQRKHPKVIEEGKKMNYQDLYDDQVVMFQHNIYLPMAITWCFLVPTLLGHFLGSAWIGFWIGGVFRYVFVLHMTWCVNSVAHIFGDRPYAPHMNAAENLFVSIGAMGEGWHNYHHKYPTDYATGEFGMITGQWNPTKSFLDCCLLLGLASNAKRSKTARATREKLAALNSKLKEIPSAPAVGF